VLALVRGLAGFKRTAEPAREFDEEQMANVE